MINLELDVAGVSHWNNHYSFEFTWPIWRQNIHHII